MTSRFLHQGFEKTIAEARAGDIVYADPPYHQTFSNYLKTGFSAADQQQLAQTLKLAYERGVAILATNNDTPEVREWYSWATVQPTGEARAVNRDPAGRGKVGCVILTTVPELLVPL